jgi:biopolymer transport protein ExbB
MFKTMLLQISVAGESTMEVVPVEKKLRIIELLINAGWYIMVPLAILSIVAIYIFIERYLAVQKASKEDANFMNQIKDFISDGKIEAAKSLCAQTDGPYSRMILKGIKRIGKPLSDISAAIENDGRLEVYQLERNLSTLATIAGAAPMIGFLGTVIGMINTFHEMYAAGNSVEISELSGGIMQAMVTTAAGLVIGIVAYVGYNLLVSKIDKVVNKMESTTIEFMDVLQDPA